MKPFTIQRFRATQNTSTEVWRRTFDALESNRAAADEVWFSTGIGFPPMDWHREHSARLASAAEDLRRIGILPSLEIQAVIGHGDTVTRYRDDTSAKTWRGWTGPDGREAEACGCPRDPALARYFAEVGRIYAAWRPASLWFDDDIAIRSRAPGVGWPDASRFPGCWCDRCIADFSARDGQSWTRETLSAAIGGDRALFSRWATFCFDSLADLVGAIAAAIHEISPETVFGYQHGYVPYGRDGQLVLFRRLHEISGRKVRSRPGGGAYLDHDPWPIIEKAYEEARQMRAIGMPDFVESYCPEIESCPRSFGCKTAQGLLLESFMSLSQGMDALSYFIADGELEDPSWYGEALFAPIAHNRQYLEDYVRDNEGAVPSGLDLPFSSPPFRFPYTGVPLCAGKGLATGTLLTGEALAELADGEVAEILKGNVLLDGATADALCKRGFSDALAGLSLRCFDATVREYFTDDSVNGGLSGCCNVGGPFASYGLSFSDRSAHVRVAARILDGAGNRLGDGTCLVERADGSRFAILGVDGYNAQALSSRRIVQLGGVADFVAGGRLSCRLETPALIVVQPRVEADGRLRSVAVANPRIDTLHEGTRLRLRGVPEGTSYVAWYSPELFFPGARGASLLQLDRDGPDAWVELPELPPMGYGYLCVEAT